MSNAPDGATLASPQPNLRAPTFSLLILVFAALLLFCGACSAICFLITPFASARADALQSNVVFGSLAGLGILLGGALLWQGARAYQGRASRAPAHAFPRVFIFALAFVGAILLGIGTLGLGSFAAYIFPPWHFIAALAAPLAIIAYAAHRLGRASELRTLLASFTWGVLGATTLAFIGELIVLVGLIFIAAIFLAISFPNFSAVDQLRLLGLRGAADANFASNPLVVIGFIIYFGGIVPPIEEALKVLVVAFSNPKRTRQADAVLWGISAGAGFAVLENLFNGALSLGDWATVTIIRVGATIMHAANGATMGEAWHAARVEGRWMHLVIAYGASVFFHAAWNVAAILGSNAVGGGAIAQAIALIALSGLGAAWLARRVGIAERLARSAPASE
ncbi:MAG: PrsW family intramembrane metalloprotease [Chloroflexi bacterium]|nr:PrsW family intramembrane metalloprotease [Chloroflexota bacterium]